MSIFVFNGTHVGTIFSEKYALKIMESIGGLANIAKMAV